MQSAITQLFAGVPVSDLDVSIDWYTRYFGHAQTVGAGKRFFGRSTSAPGSLSSGTRRGRARGRIALEVGRLDALLERLAAQRIEHEPIESYRTVSAT